MTAKEAPERLMVAEVEDLVHLLEFGAWPEPGLQGLARRGTEGKARLQRPARW